MSRARFSAAVGIVLGVVVGSWILWTYRGDSDYEQVVGWAVGLGLIVAVPFLLYGLIAWVTDRPKE